MASNTFCPESYQIGDVVAVMARVRELLSIQAAAVEETVSFIERAEREVRKREADAAPPHS
jgi:hypothetical protein